MAVVYALVDTCVLSDIISQYDPSYPHKHLSEGKNLKKKMLGVVNGIIGDEDDNGYIIASSFAFVELINRFNVVFEGAITIERLISILVQPPSWLIIEDINEETAMNFCDVPNSVEGKNVSSDDAVHVATAMQRGDDILFLTTDNILSKMKLPKITFINT
jgi:predicted nucleic acid-binding protein